MVKPGISTTSVGGIFRAQAPPSTLPRTAVTGASRDRCSRIAGSPMSPAWMMRLEPRSASRASGRISPWVSEMTPMVDTAILVADDARAAFPPGLNAALSSGRGRHPLEQDHGVRDGGVVGSHSLRSLGLEADAILGNAKQGGHTLANLRRVRPNLRGRQNQRRIDARNLVPGGSNPPESLAEKDG